MNAFAGMHQVADLIDAFLLQVVGNHRVDLDRSVHAPLDNIGNVGSALGPAKCRTASVATCYQRVGTRGDFLPGLGHPDNDRSAPIA